MNPLGEEGIQNLVLLGSFCACGAIAGVILASRRSIAPWPRYLAGSVVVFGLLTACTIVGLRWIAWVDYDKGIRKSVDSAREQGYEIRRALKSDGTVVYEVKNYVVPDGSFTIFANRSPFRPEWSFVATLSLCFGTVTALVSLMSRGLARRLARA